MVFATYQPITIGLHMERAYRQTRNGIFGVFARTIYLVGDKFGLVGCVGGATSAIRHTIWVGKGCGVISTR